ncbi:hypothetical protein K488DRAFT_87614 [Vararia minispora EC-137]|uniref:Uncharacterized protein n=1 Tax=Vararia minispora EC-137 TaxID=1314806 RepID=A0ACB8QG98_9AGAM|nr:hypothetical protein K488DRAFT_87614 [Vararia minispora EC-137]
MNVLSALRGTRPLPKPVLPRAPLHTTAPLLESERAKASRLARQRNRARSQELAAARRAAAPHPALGTSSARWTSSRLARCLTTADAVRGPDRTISVLGETLSLPAVPGFGVGAAEERLLFAHLPVASAHAQIAAAAKATGQATVGADTLGVTERHTAYLVRALRGADVLARMIDLRNAGAEGRAFVDRQRIVRAFARDPERRATGSPEVQAAILTYEIRNCWEHLHRAPRDIHGRRGLRRLLHKRQRVLRFLKRLDRARYEALLPRIGVEPAAVEREIAI